MAEQIPHRPKLVTRPVHETIYTERFQDAIQDVNQALTAYSTVDEETARSMYEAMLAEEGAVESFYNEFFGLQWLEREVRIVAIENDDPGSNEMGIVKSIAGKLMGLIPQAYEKDITVKSGERSAVIQQMVVRTLVLLVEEAGGSQHTVDLTKGHILSMEADIPPERKNGKTILGVLHIDNEALSHLLHTETFLSMDIKTQKSQLFSILNEINRNPPILYDLNTIYNVDVTDINGKPQYSLTGDQVSVVFPGLEERKKRYKKPADYKNGTELWLQIADTETGSIQHIPISRVSNITTSERNGDGTAKLDVLRLFESDDFVTLATNAENAINYCQKERERNNLIASYTQDISAILPEQTFASSFFVTGTVFREAGDTLEGAEESHDDVIAAGIDIKHVNGKWRVVFALDVNTGETGTNIYGQEPLFEPVFVIPDRSFTQELYGVSNACYDITEQYNDPLREACLSAADAVKELILSKRFSAARLERQITMIDEELADLRQATKLVENVIPGGRLGMTVTNYYAVDINVAGLTCADIASMPHANGSGLYIEFDDLSVAVPECVESRYIKFQSIKDFPLSKGEPMIIAEDTAKGITYFVPAQSVISTRSVINNDNYE